MDNTLYTSQNPTPQNNKRKALLKKLATTLGILFIIFPLVIISFYLGRRSQKETYNKTATSPEPTKVEISPTPTPTISPTPSRRPTPTSKLTPTPALKTFITPVISDLDGFASSTGEVNTNLEIRVGRNSDSVSRGFVSFSLNELPQGVTIKEVRLRLFQLKIVGAPYADGGKIMIDHLTYGNSLDRSDYGLASLIYNAETLSTNSSVGLKDVDVTWLVKNDVDNARTLSQFRIHFSVENVGESNGGDYSYFESSENISESGNSPQLIIRYY